MNIELSLTDLVGPITSALAFYGLQGSAQTIEADAESGDIRALLAGLDRADRALVNFTGNVDYAKGAINCVRSLVLSLEVI